MKHTLTALVLAAASVSAPVSALAGGMVDAIMPEHAPNVVGMGIGFAPDYAGSDDSFVGIAPMARVRLGESHRYAQLFINEAQLNLIDSAAWRAGPVLNYDFGRKDVADSTVKHMRPIDGGLEYGAFVQYQSIDAQNPRNRWSVGLTGLSRDNMMRARLSAQYFQQVHPVVDVIAGVGLWYGDTQRNNTYFGVNARNRGTSGLPDFAADSGTYETFANLGAIVYVDKHWAITGGLRYTHIASGSSQAADSPLVSERGAANTWAGGVGVTYLIW